jgi:hypothetical protein
MLSPQEDEALLEEAGFSGVSLFYAGLSFRGWVAYGDDLRWSAAAATTEIRYNGAIQLL